MIWALALFGLGGGAVALQVQSVRQIQGFNSERDSWTAQASEREALHGQWLAMASSVEARVSTADQVAQKAEGTAEAAKRSLSTLTGQLTELKAQRAQLETERSEAIDKKERALAQHAQLQEGMRALNGRSDAAQADYQELAKKIQELLETEKKIHSRTQALVKREGAVSKELKLDRDDLASLQEQRAAIRAELSKSDSDWKQASEFLKEAINGRQEEQTRRVQIEAEAKALGATEERLGKEVSSLQGQVAELKEIAKANSRAKADYKTLAAKLKALNKRIDQYETRLAGRRAQVAAASEKLKGINSQVAVQKSLLLNGKALADEQISRESELQATLSRLANARKEERKLLEHLKGLRKIETPTAQKEPVTSTDTSTPTDTVTPTDPKR